MITVGEMRKLLGRVLEVSEDTGNATSGTATTLTDASKGWAPDGWAGSKVHVIHKDIEYVRTVSSNTDNTLTFSPELPEAVSAGDPYMIRAITAPYDMADRADRVLGQLTDGTSPIDPRQIRTITETLSVGNPPNFDVLLSTRASESTLSSLSSRLPASLTASGNLKAAILEDAVGLAKSTDVLPMKDVTQHLSSASIAAGATTNVDTGPITDRTGILVILRATYNAAATAGVRCRFLYSPDGTNYDSPEDADAQGNYFEPTFAAGATRQVSAVVPFLSPYVRLAITNKDTAQAATVSLWTVRVK
jgi:hypothetical protein